MSAATTATRKRMGITTIVSSIIIVSSLVWAAYSFGIIQFGVVRDYNPHQVYDDIPYWPYDTNFTGGRTNWFDNINYTDMPLDLPLPEDLLDQLDDMVFVVTPGDPGQLWRTGSYDVYDGSRWSKSINNPVALSDEESITLGEATETVYTIFFYATAGATVGAIELPTIFPNIRIIEDSFKTYTIVDNTTLQEDIPSRLMSYELETDIYGTLLLSPFIQGTTGEDVLMSYDITYVPQDIDNVIANARDGASAPPYTAIYRDLSLVLPLSQRVIDNITPFETLGDNAYEKAMAVQVYFQSTFDLIIDQAALSNRPVGQETTDWFIQNGGGLPMDFATAYCVFMRYLGIPARMVMGYALGERDPVFDQRTVMVRHMQFWAEVFIPMAGGDGEWIQVIPTPLPSQFGGFENPENTPIPDIELLIWPTSGQPWAQIGDPFNLSTSLTVEGVPVTTPEPLIIYDELDSVLIGTYTLGEQITYAFPPTATIDYHIISATWQPPTLYVVNATSIYAVGTPNPMSNQEDSIPTDFVLSETRELNVSQGMDTHIAYWEDTVHVYGTMKFGDGTPVNSSNYGNQNIGIYWDNTFMGNASIDEYGYYELNILVNPLDLVDMTVGQHEVWSWYLGDWDGPVLKLNEARSDNSTVTVWGRVSITLSVTPTDAYKGATLYYDGSIQFLNGTLLPSGQSVGVFFDSLASDTRPVNVSGGFSWTYMIPIDQADGTYWARANWTSPWQYIAGNWSISIPIFVEVGGSTLTIIQLPDPLFIGETVTINGTLTHTVNGTGIGGQWVDVWWYNGITVE
ncbi:MAG: transglutaminase-like domain-containing protein, partial [Candidatus Thorarchaeota archaeon]